MSAVQCVRCELWSLRDNRLMAAQGFGRCGRSKPYRYFGATRQRECRMHKAVAPEKAERRIVWLAKVAA